MTDKSDEPHDPTDMDHPDYDSAKDPTSPFYKSNKTEAEQKPELSDEDPYKVGPGRPPKEHTWKKGCRSPYPKGRPRKVPSMKPDLKKALEAALNEKVVITKDKKEIVLTKAALGIQQLESVKPRATATPAAGELWHVAQLGGPPRQGSIEEALGTRASDCRRPPATSLPTSRRRHQGPCQGTLTVDDDVPKVTPGRPPQTLRTASPTARMPVSKPSPRPR
jgi:hypothetical protein